jgi:hypothetical protein
MLPKRHQRQARKFAAQAWNEVNSEDLSISPEKRLEVAKQRVRDRISEKYSKRGFQSVWTSILISILIKVATRMLERWLEKRMFSVSEDGDE